MRNAFRLFVLTCGICLTGFAWALPVSSCANNTGSGFTCNIYESLANGSPSEISNVITLPSTVGAGYLVFLEAGGSLANQSTWSDVAVFGTGTGSANQLQFFSEGCNIGFGNRSCFPSFATVNDAPHNSFFENPLGTDTTNPTVFVAAGPNTYNFFSAPAAAPAAVPEPGSLALLGVALGAFGMSRRRKKI